MPSQDYLEALATLQVCRPANDNAPVSAEAFTTMAERRAFVQRPQGRPAPILNLPTLERLGRSSPDTVRLWHYWRDLQASPAPDIYTKPEVAFDHAIAGELRPENGIEAEAEPVNSGFSEGGEQDLEIRPTIDEIERSTEGVGRVAVVCTVCNGQRSNISHLHRPCERGSNARIGDLVFRNGTLVQWGRTKRGVSLAPVERLRASKGSRKPRAARDFRFLVQTNAPFVRKVDFLAGKTHSTGRSGAPLECFAEVEQSRKAEESNLRTALGAHADVLDLAIGDATAREIGESRGYLGKHAERRGIFLISGAFAALRALVDENILPKAA